MSRFYIIVIVLLILLIYLLIDRQRQRHEKFTSFSSAVAKIKSLHLKPKFDSKSPWKWMKFKKGSGDDQVMAICHFHMSFHALKKWEECMIKKAMTRAVTIFKKEGKRALTALAGIGVILARMMLTYIKKGDTGLIVELLNHMGCKGDNICGNNAQSIAKCIVGLLCVGCLTASGGLGAIPALAGMGSAAGGLASFTASVTLGLKIITYPVQKCNEKLKDKCPLSAACLGYIEYFGDNDDRRFGLEMATVGTWYHEPMVCFTTSWELIEKSYKNKPVEKKKTSMFSSFIKTIGLDKISKKLGIDKFEKYLSQAGGDFINKHEKEFSKLPIDVIDRLNRMYPTVFISAPTTLEKCNNEVKHIKYGAHSMNIAQNKEPFISQRKDMMQYIRDLPHKNIYETFTSDSLDYKQNFYDNVYDFDNDKNPSSFDDDDFTRHMYHYSNYLHHLNKQEAIDLFQHTFEGLNFSNQNLEEFWGMYQDSQNIIDGKEDFDQYFYKDRPSQQGKVLEQYTNYISSKIEFSNRYPSCFK